MLLSELSTAWVKEVEEYEARMYDYFTECSVKLREWYNKGGEESEAYRQEYSRLSDEYQHYIQYIQQLREFMKKNEKAVSDSNETPPKAKETPVTACSLPVFTTAVSLNSAPPPAIYNTANAAACYTKYYQDMISYFDRILTSLEASQPSEAHDHQSADAPKDEQHDEEGIQEEAELESPFENGDLCCDPRAVMEQYFDRFGETGKWDWASWNNYLSWIARTNPQWYGIFLEYSQSLGIDWDQMYARWKMSNPLATQTLGDVCTGPLDLASIRPPNLNQPVYNGLLFGDTLQQETIETDDFDDLFCSTCQIRFSTDRVFALHLRGVTHIQRALEGLQRRNPERIDRCLVQQPQDNGAARHYAWFQLQYMQRTQSEFVRPGSLYCELCGVQSSSYPALQAHLSGKRHRDNVSIFHSTGDASLLKDKRPVPTRTAARLQTLLDVCTQPLIGLNYIVERQFGDDEECAYFCELCNDRLCRQDAIKHVCGVAHRTNYMKAHYSGMCAIVANDRSSLTMRLKRIDFFARKIEDFEGRKRVKVKRLSAFDALRRIWRPLDDTDYTPLQMPRWTPKVPRSNTRVNAMKKSTKLTSSKGQPTTASTKQSPSTKHRKPSSDDLEEGEITEDSSDEDEDARVNGICGEKNDTSVFAVGCALNAGAHECAEDTESLENDVCPEDFLPRSICNFKADTESETFVETLKKEGFLDLTKAAAEADQANKSNDTSATLSTSLDEQFAREAEWVLSRVREQQKVEEENRRQAAASVAAASKSQSLMSSAQERRIRIQRGLDAMEESRRAFDSTGVSTSSRFFYNGEYGEDSTPSHRTPAQLSPTQLEGEYDTNGSLQPPIIDSPGLGLLGPMDPNRQRLAVSSGAVEIILSALGALRDAGQLPESLAPRLNLCASPTLSKTDEQPTEPTSTVKFGLLGSASAPVSSVPKPVVQSGPTPHVSAPSRNDHSKETKLNVPSFQVNADPTSGLLDPSPSAPPPVNNNAFLSTLLRNTVGTGLLGPGLLDMSDIHTRNPGVGLLGDPLPQRPAVTVTPTIPAPLKKDSSHLSPKASQPNAKVPRPNDSSDDVTSSSESKKEERMPTINVASYMRTNATESSSEAMFDAYALYSRRSEERNKLHAPTRLADDRNHGDATRRTFRGRSRFPGHSGPPSGRKLSVIADLLGVNEPPAPHSNSSAASNSPNSLSNPSYWQQQQNEREPSYLIPVSTFSLSPSPTLPRISYYIPKNQTFSGPPSVPLSHHNSGLPPPPINSITPNFFPLPSPTITPRFIRPPVAMASFTRQF